MAGALSTFLPYPRFYMLLAVTGTVGLFLSFGIDFSQLFVRFHRRNA
jgi:hypothetical protein